MSPSDRHLSQAELDELAEAVRVARFEESWRRYDRDQARERERKRKMLKVCIVVAVLALSVGVGVGVAVGQFWQYVSWPYLP